MNRNVQIFHFVDGFYNPRTITGTLKKGSAPLKRELSSHKCNAVALPRPMLPLNFYSNDIGEERIKTLDPKPVLKLPKVCSLTQIVDLLTHLQNRFQLITKMRYGWRLINF